MMANATENMMTKMGSGAGLVKIVAILSVAVLIGGCASTPPTKIGGDTYYSSKTNTAGIFGDVGAVSGKLMVEGNQFCASIDKEFELVTQTTTSNIPGVRLGGASITFRCVAHANDVHLRPDSGVTTTTTQ